MIDPELEAVLDFMPVIDLDDPVAARREFEKLLVTMRTPMPEAELLEIEDRGSRGGRATPRCPCASTGRRWSPPIRAPRCQAFCRSMAGASSSAASKPSTRAQS